MVTHDYNKTTRFKPGHKGFKPDKARQCEHICRTGLQCIQFKSIGEKYCNFHLRRVYKRLGKRNKSLYAANIDMAREIRYKRLGAKLKAQIQEALDSPETERISLEQELEIVRRLADDAFALYAGASELPDENKKKNELLQAATTLAMQALEQVRVYCKTTAEVSAMGRDKFSIHSLQDVANQIVKIVYQCFDDNERGLQRFDRMLSEQLRLPIIGAQGTKLTPDKDAMSMDDSVPSVPLPDYSNWEEVIDISVEQE